MPGFFIACMVLEFRIKIIASEPMGLGLTERDTEMPIAIFTRYHGPTDTKGARITATCRRDNQTTWKVSIGFDYALDCGSRHALAAQALVDKHMAGLSTLPLMHCGNTSDNRGYVFAINPKPFLEAEQ
jgi:hypothetical protein